MPIWLGAGGWIVATGWGIARWDGAAYEVFRYPRTGVRSDQDPPALEVFAVLDDGGRSALIQRAGEPATQWQSGAAEVSACTGARLRAAIGAGGGRVVAIVDDPAAPAAALLRRARVVDGAVVLEEPIALPTATRASWASPLWKGRPAFPEDREPSGGAAVDPRALGAFHAPTRSWLGDVRVAESPHGIAVTSTYSGLVAVLDRDTLAARFAVRVPTDASQYAIHALPVPQGVLVTLVADGRHTEYVLIGADGGVVATCAMLGKEPAWGAETEGVFCGETVEIASRDRLWTLALPTLRPRKHPGGADAYPIAHATAADGARLVAYTEHNYERPHHWRLVHTPGGAGRRRGREVAMPDFRPPPEPAQPATAARVVGPAALGLVADKTPWQVAVGGEVELELVLANRGGPVKGIYIELSGAASGTQVAPISIAAGDATAPFVGATPRAELPTVALEAGYVEPLGKRPRHAPPPPPPPSVVLRVRVRGLVAGGGLLMIRIGALAGGASAMQGRGITVTPA